MSTLIETTPLTTFAEKAYLDYSMYVILDRALPHIADGLKPVQRRIIYAMSELGLNALAKYKKSARTVGDVLGKFHPHGDSACYEAMVLMAQPFSYRYPFVDGQGNWGSPDDPKSFAAMRYTEARLSAYASVLLEELEQGTVEWVDNFDATLKEPSLLPARLPNVLLNGATGIAVGMACDILPHNLTEVANACILLLDAPHSTLQEVMAHIQGPDFPTQAEIISPKEQIENLYATGNGSVKMRAIYVKEGANIVITALPYQVSGARVIEQIANQMQSKKLPMIEDIRDESDHEHPTRIVLIPKSNRVETESVMSHLFATTDLEKSYRANFNMIGLNGKPCVKPLINILTEWLAYRLETVKKRLNHRLQKVNDRLHILEGLLVAFLNIDEVIQIIREEDEPKKVLMSRFSISERQAEAILEIKLRHLAKLEEMKLKAETDALLEERDFLMSTLASETKLKALIKDELMMFRDEFGDKRRSPMVFRQEAQALKEEDILPNEPITVVLSQKGWIRAAKGHDINGQELSYKAGDGFKMQMNARTNQTLIFIDSEGKVYSLPGHTLPSARGQGEPLSSKLNPGDKVSFVAMVTGDPKDEVVISSDVGYGFITTLESLYVKNKNGKACLKLPEKSNCLIPRVLPQGEDISVACVTNTGHLLVFKAASLPRIGRGKGNKMMQIPAAKAQAREEYIVDIQVFNPQQKLVLKANKRQLTLLPADLSAYQGERGRRGHRLPRGLQSIAGLVVE